MNWRLWLKRERLIPIGTVIVVLGAEVLGLSHIIPLNVGEHIILWLLLLIAFDALIERVTILERISSDIRNIRSYGTHFQTRSQLPSLEERLVKAQSIDIAAMSLLVIASQHYTSLRKKVTEDKCKIRLVRLNPNNDFLIRTTCIFSGFTNPDEHKQEIITAWNRLTSDKEFFKLESEHVELYTYNFPLAHGLFIVNGDKDNGVMRVEMYMGNKTPSDAPGFPILKAENPELFNTFLDEFKEILNKATLYKPT